MSNYKLEAPWYTYQKKVKAMFDRDPDISVGEVYQRENGKDYGFDIEVYNHVKYLALDRVLNRMKVFGSVALFINLFDDENDQEDDAIAIYKTIFEGNPIVHSIEDMVDAAGTHHGYVVFEPEIIQFYDDDLSDYRRNWTGLAQNIARELFDDAAHSICFCTADIRENEEGEDPTDTEEPSELME
jgi:hypothetical protein